MKITTLILTSLLSLCISQNIITSWNYDKVAMYDLQKLSIFLNTFLKEPLDIPCSLSKDKIKINNIKLIQIETNLYDSLINYNTGLLLLAPNKITLSFNFSYEETSKQLKDSATLSLSILTFKLKFNNDKKEQKTNFEIKMSSPPEGYTVPGIKDKDFLKSLLDLLYEGFNENNVLNKIIAEKMQTDLYNYYSEFYKKNPEIKIQTQKFFGNLIIPIKTDKFIYFCEDILGEYKTAFCYYSGEIEKNINNEDKTLIPLKNERFSHNAEDLYIIFINNDLIKDSMDYIVKNYFSKNAKIYDEKTNVKTLSYDFTVASLQKYFKGLENIKKEEKFDCEINIEKGDINEVTYKVKINIKDTAKTNFEIRITSGLTLDISIIKTIRFNICVKNTKTLNVEMITSSIQISDLDGLKKVIEESFDFKYNPICLNNKGISLKNQMTEISKAYILEEGIYFEGPQLYQ